MLAVGASRSRTITQYGENARLATGGTSQQLAQEIEELELDAVTNGNINIHAPAVLESLAPMTDYRPCTSNSLVVAESDPSSAVTPKVVTTSNNMAWSHTPPAIVMSEAAAYSEPGTPTSKLQKAPRAPWGGYGSTSAYDFHQKDEARAQRARRTEALTSSVVTEEEWDALESGRDMGIPSFLLASRPTVPLPENGKKIANGSVSTVNVLGSGWD